VPSGKRRQAVHYPPESFRLISGELSEDDLKQNPMWSEHYDHDERLEIEAWGVEPNWLDAEIKRLPRHPHPIYPVLRHKPFPERMRLFIAATFETPGKHILQGYLVNVPPHAVCLFVGEASTTLNCHPMLRDFLEDGIKSIQARLGCPNDPILPLTFHSQVLGPDGAPICGTFGV
jgi:hypothetical protein